MPGEDGGPLVIPVLRRRRWGSCHELPSQTSPIRELWVQQQDRISINKVERALGRQAGVNLRPPYTCAKLPMNVHTHIYIPYRHVNVVIWDLNS